MDTLRICLLLNPSHSTPDLSGLGFTVLVLVFILGMISPRGGRGREVAVLNMPSRFNSRLALRVWVYATAHRDCLGLLGERAGFGRQELGGQIGAGARKALALSFEALSPVGD